MNWSRIKNWFNEPLIVKPDLSELHLMLASFTTNLNAVNTAFLEKYKAMVDKAEQDLEAVEGLLETDVATITSEMAQILAALAAAQSSNNSAGVAAQVVKLQALHARMQGSLTLTVGPTSLDGATAGQAYNQTLTVEGGIEPYTFNNTTSSDAGVSVDASTGAVSGIPASASGGSFTIAGTVDDSSTPPLSGAFSYTVPVA